MFKTLKELSFIFLLSLITACADKSLIIPSVTVTKMQVASHYADMAYATYSDALITAKNLQNTIKQFIFSPSREHLNLAKQAWLKARVPYGQTEVFRFGNPNVDAWEGKVNAWPLDEGLIDYVDEDSYEFEDGNRYGQANIISGSLPITIEALRNFHEMGGAEVNVATGYHAIEFLLWGQDLNEKPTDAGLRSYTDYLTGEDCTHGNCERRVDYLTEITNLLVSDLKDMVNDWAPGKNNYRKSFLALKPDATLRIILFGMGSLSLGELAGERLNVSLLAHSQEDEHSCFSDNTHIDASENARGIQNIYLGRYQRIDGTVIKGPSVANLVAQSNSELAQQFANEMQTTMKTSLEITHAARAGEAFDQQIKADNKAGNNRIRAMISALKQQAATLKNVASEIGIKELSPQSSDNL